MGEMVAETQKGQQPFSSWFLWLWKEVLVLENEMKVESNSLEYWLVK